MSLSRSYVKVIVSAVLGLCAVKIASLIKVSFIVGSQVAFFSGSSIAMPLTGLLGGSLGAFVTLLGMYCVRLSWATGWNVAYLAYHIPGLCAAVSWNMNNVIMRVVLPLSCMVLFIVHPIGSQAWVYSLYWLIPVIIYYSKSQIFFLQALASTFIAHAVGSLIWLYTVPMTVAMWHALVPVVAVERLLFASAMVVVHVVIMATKRYVRSYRMGLHSRVATLVHK